MKLSHKGTELYVKIEAQSVKDQFSKGSRDGQWEKLTLWFGVAEVTAKHKLWPWGTGNRYSLVENLRAGRYQLAGGEVVGVWNVERKIKTGNYGYVALGDEQWRSTYNWASRLEFGKDSCRYQRNEVFKEKDWTITVRCAYGNYWRTGGRDGRSDQFVEWKLTKDDYVFLN